MFSNNLTPFSTEEILNIFLEEKKLIRILFETNENIYFLNTILEVAYQKCQETWLEDNKDLSVEEIEYASVFIFNGALGIVNFWVKNNFDKANIVNEKIINNFKKADVLVFDDIGVSDSTE